MSLMSQQIAGIDCKEMICSFIHDKPYTLSKYKLSKFLGGECVHTVCVCLFEQVLRV